jgi:hypothetical protein
MTESKKHEIYLAVPGRNFCWGTVTGVLGCTRQHCAHPYNGGGGFSCVVDFNVLWTAALNQARKGEVTHFAMLHGDIYPSTDQCWLDILLEEMDARGAALVSAHSPIKDDRGLTSVGIYDPQDPWRPFRRFTIQEVLERLPETWDAAAAGYPDKGVLHNTAMWVADLRLPHWFEKDASGRLKFHFAFPEEIVQDQDGSYVRQQESEDWYFSRRLWEAGIKNTWITRRVKFEHEGPSRWPNDKVFGRYRDGDEDTRDKWRPAQDGALSLVQILEFELGSQCNLATIHSKCPNADKTRWGDLDTSRELDDETIVSAAVTAYQELGFTGLVGWIYYNEPLMQAGRVFGLMERIKRDAPAARFMLWTNGSLIPADCASYRQFEQIVISGYGPQSARGRDRLAAQAISCRYIENATLDDRMVQVPPADRSAACTRPYVEMIFDCHGNTHLCCYDFRGRASYGNLISDGIRELADRWRNLLPKVSGRRMEVDAPQFCRDCGHRWSEYQIHDSEIVNRVRRWRKSLGENERDGVTRLPGANEDQAEIPNGGNKVDVYELLGRSQHELANLRQEYAKLLGLVERLKAGSVKLDEVQVNLAASSWNLVPLPTPPAEEAQPAEES